MAKFRSFRPRRSQAYSVKTTRLNLDDEYEIYATHDSNKASRNSMDYGRSTRASNRNGGKAYGSGHTGTSRRYDFEKRAEIHGQPGYSRAAEAFELLLRAFTVSSKTPPIIGFDSGHVSLDDQQCDELVAMLQEDSFSLVMNEFSPPFRAHQILDQSVWRGPHGLMLICGQSGRDVGDNITIASGDRVLVHRYLKWWRSKFLDEFEKSPYAKVSGVFQSQTGIEVKDFSSPIGWPLDRMNYGADVLAFYDKISAELISDTPIGRLAILDGKPGGGKTFLLRGLVQDLSANAHFVYLPASLVPSMDGPQILSMLDEMSQYSRRDERPRHKVFIVEDADECLVSRGADNISAIRNLLNFCDGFLGTMLDVRIVATTNSGFVGRTDKVDVALLRPGRLIARATITPLGPDELKAWFAHRTDGNVPENLTQMTLAEAYGKARDLGWKPPGSK